MTIASGGLRARALTAVFATALGVLASAAYAQEVTTIRWGSTAPASVPHALSAMLALDPAVQEKHGIKVDFIGFNGNSSNCMAALIGNSVDFCQTGVAAGPYAIAEGADLKSFSMMGGQVGEIVINKAAAEKAGIKLDAPVSERIAGLKGMQIVGSGPGTPNYMLLDAILKEGGLTINDIQFRTLVDITAMNEGIRNGSVDGAFWSVGGLAPAKADGSALQVLSLARGDIPKFKDIPLTAIFTQAAWLEQNREVAKRVKAALVEINEKLIADPLGYSAAFKKEHLDAVPQDVWEGIIKENMAAFFPDLTGTAEGWDFWIDIMRAEGKPGTERATFANAFDTLE